MGCGSANASAALISCFFRGIDDFDFDTDTDRDGDGQSLSSLMSFMSLLLKMPLSGLHNLKRCMGKHFLL